MDFYELCNKCRRLTDAALVPVDKRDVTFEYTPITAPSAEHDCWLFSDKSEPSPGPGPAGSPLTSLSDIIGILCEKRDPDVNSTNPLPYLAGHEEVLKAAYRPKKCHLCNLVCSRTDVATVELGNSDPSGQVIGIPTLQMIAPKRTWDTTKITSDPACAKAHPDAKLLFSVLFIRRSSATVLSETALDVAPDDTGSTFSPSSARESGFLLQTVKTIRGWLHECQSHAECQQGRLSSAKEPFWLPTRLLEIVGSGEDTHLRLVNTSRHYKGDTKPKYATLSHTWGRKGPPIRLTSNNHYRFVSRIPPDQTPPTFKQAAVLCNLLGIKYLWIDALCIIQDSLPEWAYELSRMYDVYSEAVVNIAATASDNSDQGLLVQNYHLTPVRLNVNWALSGASSNLLLSPPTFDDWLAISRAPLNSRGWVFQERLLSNRIVHFAKDQVWLECRRSLQSELPTSGKKETPDSMSLYRWFKRGAWTVLIMEYSSTNLTKPTDRLAAFSGVAAAFTEQHGYDSSNYVAGLLLPDILPQLTWFCESPTDQFTNVAPTWSWASLLARIKFFDEWQLQGSTKGPGSYIQEWHPSLEVKEVRLNSVPNVPFNHFRRGSMRIEGVLSEARLIDNQIPQNESAFPDMPGSSKPHGYWVDVIETGGERYERNPIFDKPQRGGAVSQDAGKMQFRALWDGPEPRAIVYLVPLQRFRSRGNATHASEWPAQTDIYTALILLRVHDKPNTYQRLGLMVFSHSSGQTPKWLSTSARPILRRPSADGPLTSLVGGTQSFDVV